METFSPSNEFRDTTHGGWARVITVFTGEKRNAPAAEDPQEIRGVAAEPRRILYDDRTLRGLWGNQERGQVNSGKHPGLSGWGDPEGFNWGGGETK